MKNDVEFFLSPLLFNLFIIHWEIPKTADDFTIIPLPFPLRLCVILCFNYNNFSGGKVAIVKI